MKIVGFATRPELTSTLEYLVEQVAVFRSAHELLKAVQGETCDAILIELQNDRGQSTIALIEALRARSEAALLGMVRVGETHDLLEIPRAVQCGLDDLIFVDNLQRLPAMICSSLEQLSMQRTIADVMRRLQGVLPDEAFALLQTCVRCASTSWDAHQLATMMGVHRVTLARHFSEAGLLSPAATLRWGRLLVASGLLEQQDRSVERVADMVALPSGRSLRHLSVELVGMSPSSLRDSGDAIDHVAAAFMAECRCA